MISFNDKFSITIIFARLSAPSNTKYDNICFSISKDSDGVKLIICGKVFNGLIVSNSRIDKDLLPEVGPTKANFLLNKNDSASIEIYVEETAM